MCSDELENGPAGSYKEGKSASYWLFLARKNTDARTDSAAADREETGTRKEHIARAICCTGAGIGLLTALCCCGAVFAQEPPPPQQQQPPNALAAAPAQEQIQQNATSTCVQPPLGWGLRERR